MMVELGMAKSRNEALNIILGKDAKEVILEIQEAMNSRRGLRSTGRREELIWVRST